MATLEVCTGTGAREFHELASDEMLLGRDQFCDIVLRNHTVSRQHARIVRADDGFYIEDLSSLNGTYVNGRRIKERTRLKHGDRLRFHRKEFEFVLWEMFETDRTEMSQTMFASMLDGEDSEATQMRATNDDRESSSTSTTER